MRDIQFRDVAKSYGDVEVIAGLSLHVHEGASPLPGSASPKVPACCSRMLMPRLWPRRRAG